MLLSLRIHLAAQENILPHLPTRLEEEIFPDYLLQLHADHSRSIPQPPPGNVRTMAEWEEIQALVITWAGQSTILREIVRHAVQECKVLIITTNPTNVTTSLTNAGIPLDSVRFVNTEFNSIWVRDYGPWTVYKNDVDSLYLIDWIYNRPREDDDATPVALADYLGIPVYEAIVDPDDLVHTGGNHLPDGMGTAFSSMLVLEENPDKTEDEIDSIVQKYLGVKQYIKFPTLPYDGIHHLDMHMRVIDEETIIFGEYPDGVADGPQINANIDYLINEFQTSFGNRFNIVRIPMPPQNDRFPDQGGDYRTYTNSIFVNKTILVPTYEERYDTTALRIYKENLPGYNVVGINCNSIIPSLGALHCITKLVGVNDPLMIAHPRLRDSDDPSAEYPVQAIIKHRSGIAEASLYYRTKGDSQYVYLPMTISDSLLATWSATIPSHPAGTEIQYYIHAIAKSGKHQVRPIVAPEGYFNFHILGEPLNQPPTVRINAPLDGAVLLMDSGTEEIEIDADDPDGTVSALILFINGDSITTLNVAPYHYTWNTSVPGIFDIYAVAIDDKGMMTVSDTVSVTVENTTSEKSPDEYVFEFFPNPVKDVLWIRGEGNQEAQFKLIDLLGQSLVLQKLNDGELAGLDLSGFAPGIYILQDEWGRSYRIIRQ